MIQYSSRYLPSGLYSVTTVVVDNLFQTLNWALSPVTVSQWMVTYLQLLHAKYDQPKRPPCKYLAAPIGPKEELLLPQFEHFGFLQLSRVSSFPSLLRICPIHPLSAASALCS